MRLSRASSEKTSISALPSILTKFPTSSQQSSNKKTTHVDVEKLGEEGLEITPIEWCNSDSAKIVSPGTEEKEVVTRLSKPPTKPLPPLPKTTLNKIRIQSRWYQLSRKQRGLALLLVQLGVLVTIGLSLLSIKSRLVKRSSDDQLTGTMRSPDAPNSTALPDGAYLLTLNYPRKQSAACLPINEESATWTCSKTAVLRIAVSSENGQPRLSAESFNMPNTSTPGQQHFFLSPATLDLVNTSEQQDLRVAYHFRASYDRTVLVASTQLSFTNAQPPAASELRSKLAPKDQPWLCYFNNTIVEGYIYPSLPTSAPPNSTNMKHDNVTTSTPAAPPPLPYVVNISEQWQPGGTRAYCEQHTVLETGQLRNNGGPKYFLSTGDSAVALAATSTGTGGNAIVTIRAKRRQDISEDACQCQWTVQ